MKSPITGKEMQVRHELVHLAFRKEEFEVVTRYYECGDSGERCTDDRLDELSMVQVHNQYREKYGIPFPEEIRRIRETYGISASKMWEILGLGANSYRLYEAGEVPSIPDQSQFFSLLFVISSAGRMLQFWIRFNSNHDHEHFDGPGGQSRHETCLLPLRRRMPRRGIAYRRT